MKAEIEFHCDGCGRSSHVMIELNVNGSPLHSEYSRVMGHIIEAFVHEANHEHEEGISIAIRRPTP